MKLMFVFVVVCKCYDVLRKCVVDCSKLSEINVENIQEMREFLVLVDRYYNELFSQMQVEIIGVSYYEFVLVNVLLMVFYGLVSQSI